MPTTTSTSWSATVSTQVSWSDPAGELLVGTQTPDIGLVGIDRFRNLGQHAEGVQRPEGDPDADGTVSTLDADDRPARDACSVGDLRLRQAAKLPPRLDVTAELAERAPHRERRWVGIGSGHNVR
jgi:hypothetical protein